MPDSLQAAAKPRPKWVARIWASADDGDSARSWVKPAAMVVLGVALGQIVSVSGCNTTPNQLRVSDLTTRVAALEVSDKTMEDRYKPRKELDGDDLLRARSYDQMNKRLDHLDQIDDELVQSLARQVH